ncbi:MAG: 50S ribosomal protein L4 [Candidatus Saccharimonadales bacterium]
MAAVATFTKSGSKATTAAKLDKAVFGLNVQNHDLLKQAYLVYLANGRSAAARVKTRGLVSGGGRKPWKQKGTGRARFGSIRNPIWRGGGIVFGPTGHENYTQKLSTKSKRQAIRQALSLASQEGKLAIIESLDVKSGKTADAAKLFSKLGATRKVLVVVDSKTPELVRACQNLDYIKVVQAKYVNVFDAVNSHTILITAPALKQINDWLTATPEAVKTAPSKSAAKEIK